MRVNDVTLINRTNARGHFEFTVKQPGVYTVVKHPLPGSEPTTPLQMRVVVFRDANGLLTNFLDADFGCFEIERPLPHVTGMVFLDGNRNGIPDPNESGIVATITVTAYPPDRRIGEVCAMRPLTVTTDRTGRFFIVPEDVGCDPPWLIQRGPVDIERNNANNVANNLFGTTPRDQVFFGYTASVIDRPVLFGLAPADTSQEVVLVVEGIVFIDSNANGSRDLNEPPANGVRLDLLSPCDRQEASWTNGNGYYRFEPPSTGWCEINGVSVSIDADRMTTTNPVLFEPPVQPGIRVIRADFGVRPQ
jgi:hypothetical protein